MPKEALGILVGKHYTLPEPDSSIKFTKITDWATGEVDASHIGAQFTEKGLMEYNMYLDERYGIDRPEGPFNVGLFHSHPFSQEPHFSSTDLSTFLVFPYFSENNVFILIDPVPENPFFKVFQLRKIENEIKLIQVPWIEYSPIQKHFKQYFEKEPKNLKMDIVNNQFKNEEPSTDISNQNSDPNSQDDPIFHPPKVEEIKGNSSNNKNKIKKIKLKDYFDQI